MSKSRTQTAHFRWERFDSISLRTRISTSSSPMYLGCWTDYELPGRATATADFDVYCTWRGKVAGFGSVQSRECYSGSGWRLVRLEREVRPRVTISARFPVRASRGLQFRVLRAAPEMQGRDMLDRIRIGHDHEAESRDRRWAGGWCRNGLVSAVGYVVRSGGPKTYQYGWLFGRLNYPECAEKLPWTWELATDRLSLQWGLVIVATVALTFAFRSRTVDEQGLR